MARDNFVYENPLDHLVRAYGIAGYCTEINKTNGSFSIFRFREGQHEDRAKTIKDSLATVRILPEGVDGLHTWLFTCDRKHYDELVTIAIRSKAAYSATIAHVPERRKVSA